MNTDGVKDAHHKTQESSSISNTLHYIEMFKKMMENPETLQENFELLLTEVFSRKEQLLEIHKTLEQWIELSDLIQDILLRKKILEMTLSEAQFRIEILEEQVSKIREKLAKIYENTGNYDRAIKILQDITFESEKRIISDNYKLKIYILILQNLLKMNNITLMNTYFGKAALLNHNTCESFLLFRLKFIQAQFYDKNQKFLEASKKYYELSTIEHISEAERLEFLSAAIICIALSPSCPAKSKILATFFEDSNFINLSNYFILEKMHLKKILFPDEIEKFRENLKPYQDSKFDDGTTIFTRAIIEHNLLSASKIYNNINFSELGQLLGISADIAHDYAAKMIEQGIISGKIDQISELVLFDDTDQIHKIEMKQYDNSIQKICAEIENISSKISLKHKNYIT